MKNQEPVYKDSVAQVALRRLEALYGKQTTEEKVSEESLTRNGVGFNRWDAHILTRVAKFAVRNQGLTMRQINCVNKKLAKYHRQINGILAQTNLEFTQDQLPKRAPNGRFLPKAK